MVTEKAEVDGEGCKATAAVIASTSGLSHALRLHAITQRQGGITSHHPALAETSSETLLQSSAVVLVLLPAERTLTAQLRSPDITSAFLS